MKKNIVLLLVVFAMFVMLPLNANAQTFESKDGTKYFLEKQNLQCDLIDINDENVVKYYGRDKDLNYIFKTINSNDYYKVNTDSCSKMGIEETLNYLDSKINVWYEIDGTNIYKITQGEFEISHIEVNANSGVLDSTKTYCQFNSILNNYECGISLNKIDNNLPLYQVAYIKHIKNLEIDSSLKYYTFSDSVDSLSLLTEVSPDDVKQAISENPENALNYYVMLDDYRNSELFKTVKNETILKLLDEEYFEEAVVYDEENDLFYITLYNPVLEENVVYDSNGNKVNTSYSLPSMFSNSLFFGYDHNSDKGAILDKDGTTLYESNDMWMLEETNYDNYVLEFTNTDNDENITLYKLYEYKVLSQDNRRIGRNSDYVAKFSGLLKRVKSIKINSVELDKENYTLTNGSTMVTLNKEYLTTLADGNYTLTVEYIDGVTLNTTFNLTDTFKVTFDANGGVFKNDIKTIDIEDIINFDYDTFEKPTRKEYKFIGFYTKDGKSYLEVMNSEAGIEEDTTFYAKWELEQEVPKTLDNITNSIIMGTISLIGLVGATIYLKKRNKVRV